MFFIYFLQIYNFLIYIMLNKFMLQPKEHFSLQS